MFYLNLLKNNPIKLSGCSLFSAASFGVMPSFLLNPRCMRLLYQQMKLSNAANFSLFSSYVLNHRSFLPFVWGWFLREGMCLMACCSRNCSNAHMPFSPSVVLVFA